jgi:hypothetical protein
LALRELCGVRTFVETGTYHGETTRAVAPHFVRVHTIEGVAERWQAVRRDMPRNVQCILGNSGEVLGEVLAGISEPALIFLDAHWIHAGQPVGLDPYQQPLPLCPLLRELDQIDMTVPHVILIDDLTFFDYPPHNRGGLDEWPSLDQVMRRLPSRFVFVRQGMLCAVPELHREAVRGWLVQHWQGEERYRR